MNNSMSSVARRALLQPARWHDPPRTELNDGAADSLRPHALDYRGASWSWPDILLSDRWAVDDPRSQRFSP